MKKVVVFGVGNIGRGLLGQIFVEGGYEVVFVDTNEAIVSALNKSNSYTIRIVGETFQELRIRPVRAVNAADIERVTHELAEASMAATAVGESNLRHVAPLIAHGMKKRRDRAMVELLNIIMCENLLGVAEFLKRRIVEHVDSPSVVLR